MEVRAFHMLQAAKRVGKVKLLLLCNVEDEDEQLIRRDNLDFIVASFSHHHPVRVKRFGAWVRLLCLLLIPWRNDWHEYLQLCSHYSSAGGKTWRRKMLGWVLLSHLWLMSRVFDIVPINCVSILSRLASGAMRSLGSICRPEDFDLLWFETTPPYAAYQKLKVRESHRLVLSAHNIEWQVSDRLASESVDLLNRLYRRLQAGLMYRLERKAHNHCDVVFHCSRSDLTLAGRFGGTGKLVCVGNGVDLGYFTPSVSLRALVPTVLFTGTFSYEPNAQAADVLIHTILPVIQNVLRDVRLIIAGRAAAGLQMRFGALSSCVQIVSDPADMRPFFNQAWLTIVPLRSGGGTRLKILEAMAMKVPVISTTIGAEGLNAVDGEVLLIRDEPSELAAAAIELLGDFATRSAIAERAAVWVKRNYSWDHLEQLAEQELRKLTASR